MAKDLRKFVNPRFLKTVDLGLLRRLFDRQPASNSSTGKLFEGEPEPVRQRLTRIFAGPEVALPQGLVADLHRIAELGTQHGMAVLQARAERLDVQIAAGEQGQDNCLLLDPKHFAMIAFLDFPAVFDAAADMLELETRSSLAEYVGLAEDVEAMLDDGSRAAFQSAASELLQRDQRGGYCRVGWYEDDGDVNVVVTHGAPITVRPVIEGEVENVISYRAADHAVLTYHAPTGRLKVGGVVLARRAALANIFAETMLGRPQFFAGPESQLLYTLGPVEQRGLGFTIDHAFDPDIRQVRITEIQVDRITTDQATGEVRTLHSAVIKDSRQNAFAALRELVPAGVIFGPDRYRVGHLAIRVQFHVPGTRATTVAVKVKPPSQAVFKRHRFEGRILELLRRNGLLHDRDFGIAAAAAE